jgi:hypothetical protein
MRRSFLPLSSPSPSSVASSSSSSSSPSQSLLSSETSSPAATSESGSETNTHGSNNAPSPSPSPPAASNSLLGRRTLAGMLSEALCSRARRVSERRPRNSTPKSKFGCDPKAVLPALEDEVPFARRAREQGKVFRGGKVDGQSPPCDIFSRTCV